MNRTDLRFGKEFYEILQCDEIRQNGNFKDCQRAHLKRLGLSILALRIVPISNH
jgi:hypothetical protein